MFRILESFFSDEPEPIIVIPDKKTSKKVSKKNRKKKTSKRKVNKKNQKVYENVVQGETEIVHVETRNEKLYNRANELICQKNKKIKSLKAYKKHLQENVKQIILKETSERDVMIENKDVIIRNKDEMIKQLLEENEKLQKKVYTFLVDNENLRRKVDTNMIEHEKDIKCLVDYTVQLHREINTLHDMDDDLGEKYSDTLAKLNKLKTEMALRNKEINGLIYSNGRFRYERNMFKEQLEKELKVKKESERYVAHLEKNVKKILKQEVEDIVGIIMKEFNKVYEDRISELMKIIPPPHILEKIKVDNNIRPICFIEASIVTERTNDSALPTLLRPRILEQHLIIDDERVISSVELTPESQGSPVSDTTSSDSDFLPTCENYIMETMIEVEENVKTSKSLTSTSEDMNVMPISSMELTPEAQKSPVSGTLSSFFDSLTSCDNRTSSAEKSMMETIVEVEANDGTSELSNSTVESNEIDEVAKTEGSSVIKQLYDSVRQLVECSDMEEIPSLDSHCQKRTKERQITSNHLWKTPPLQICEQQMIVNDERPMSLMELSPVSEDLSESETSPPNFELLTTLNNRTWSTKTSDMETIVEAEENVQKSESSTSAVEANEIKEVENTEASPVIKQFYDSVRQLVDFNITKMDESLDGHCKKITAPRQTNSNHLWRTPPIHICEQHMIVDDKKPMFSMELSPVSEDLSESETVPPNFELLTTLDNRTWSTKTSDMETIVEAEENVQKSESSTSAVEANEIKEVENTEASPVIKQFYDSVRQLVDFNITKMDESLDGHCKKITAPRQTNSNHLWRTPPIHICEQHMIVDDKKPMFSMELSPVSEDLSESETVPPNFELLTTLDNRTWSTKTSDMETIVEAEENVQKSESSTSAVEANEIKEVENTEASSVIKQFYDSVRQLVDCSKMEEFPSLNGHFEKRTAPLQTDSNHVWRTPQIHICEQQMIVNDKRPMSSMELSSVSEDLSESEIVSSGSNLWRTCENKALSETFIVETIVEESSEKTSKALFSTMEPATSFDEINKIPNHGDTVVTEQVDELGTRHSPQFIFFNLNEFPSLNGKVEKTTHKRQTDSNNLCSIPPLHICQEQIIVGDKRPMSSMELSPVSEDFPESEAERSSESSVSNMNSVISSNEIHQTQNEGTEQVDDIETPNVPQSIYFNLNNIEEFPSLNGNCEKRTHQQQTNSNHVWEQQVIVDDETPMVSMGLTLITKYLPESGTAFSYFDILPTRENRTESPTMETIIEVQEHTDKSANVINEVESPQVSSVTEQIIHTTPRFTDFNMTDIEEFPSLNGHEEINQSQQGNSNYQWRTCIARSKNSQTWPN